MDTPPLHAGAEAGGGPECTEGHGQMVQISPRMWECALCQGKQVLSVELCMAPRIDAESWLWEERFEAFREAYGYASSQTRAIPALAKLSPEEAYWLWFSLDRGMSRVQAGAAGGEA